MCVNTCPWLPLTARRLGFEPVRIATKRSKTSRDVNSLPESGRIGQSDAGNFVVITAETEEHPEAHQSNGVEHQRELNCT